MAALALRPGNHGLVVLDRDGETPRLTHDGCAPEVMRARIDALTALLLDAEDHQLDPPVEHYFADGMYMRKMFIPKGTILVGRIHRKTCMNIVAEGDIDVLTEYGARRLRAGFVGVSPEGTQKVGLAHADTVFINVFRTDRTSAEGIEDEIAFPPHVLGVVRELEAA